MSMKDAMTLYGRMQATTDLCAHSVAYQNGALSGLAEMAGGPLFTSTFVLGSLEFDAFAAGRDAAMHYAMGEACEVLH